MERRQYLKTTGAVVVGSQLTDLVSTESEEESIADQASDNMPTVTFEQGVADHVIRAFDWEVGDGEYELIVDENGEPVPGTDGQPVPIDNLGGIVEWKGETRPLRDHFVSICDYVQERDNKFEDPPYETPDHVCTICGNEFDRDDYETPENPSMYWVPSCPECGVSVDTHRENHIAVKRIRLQRAVKHGESLRQSIM